MKDTFVLEAVYFSLIINFIVQNESKSVHQNLKVHWECENYKFVIIKCFFLHLALYKKNLSTFLAICRYHFKLL